MGLAGHRVEKVPTPNGQSSRKAQPKQAPTAHDVEWLRKYVLIVLNDLHEDFAALGLLEEGGPLLQALMELAHGRRP